MTITYAVKIDSAAFEKRVTKGIRRAMRARYITKVGRRYRMGYAADGYVQGERFDMEEIMPGKPMAMLPTEDPPNDLLTMQDIRMIWAGQLIQNDAAEELGMPVERIAVQWNRDNGLTVTVVDEDVEVENFEE